MASVVDAAALHGAAILNECGDMADGASYLIALPLLEGALPNAAVAVSHFHCTCLNSETQIALCRVEEASRPHFAIQCASGSDICICLLSDQKGHHVRRHGLSGEGACHFAMWPALPHRAACLCCPP
eukprot:1146914-Pelagomonas_calceolata.AAC.24